MIQDYIAGYIIIQVGTMILSAMLIIPLLASNKKPRTKYATLLAMLIPSLCFQLLTRTTTTIETINNTLVHIQSMDILGKTIIKIATNPSHLLYMDPRLLFLYMFTLTLTVSSALGILLVYLIQALERRERRRG